jgi:3-deoxy-D-manno-octulosonic-acid transferase
LKTKGIYFLYLVLQAFALPVVLVYFLFRCARNPAYFTSLRQRLGFLSRTFRQTVPGAIWLHAVSVGEVLSVMELSHRLKSEFPRAPLFLSVGTLAGYATAQQKLAGTVTGIFYAPFDYVFAVRRVLRALSPALVIIVETEIWPNLFREAKRSDCGLVILNGRISDRTEQRYRRLGWFFREVMRWPDAVLVQSDAIRERYLAIGTPAERVRVGGNLKVDFVPREAAPGSIVRRWIEGLRPAEVWIAASTMPPASAGDIDEDDAVLAAFHALAPTHPRLLLLLAPRRPERFNAAAAKLTAAGIPFLRRTSLEAPLQLPGALLLNSIGELSGLFPQADVVFMGGTLAARGGHNILEPAFFGRPIVCGPHMENFRQIAREFSAKGAYLEIADASELAGAVDALLTDRSRAAELARRAAECAQSSRGATDRAIAAVREVAARTCPRRLPNLMAFGILWPLSVVWRRVGAWKRRRDIRRRRKLSAAVISVGNITMGGTGKTPLVVHLAEKLGRSGRQLGILTRGYGRHSLESHLTLEPGARARVGQTGDEPQIFLRSGIAPVGIGADRFRTGQLLEQRFGADVLLLDDGFQHLRLERQVDLVLVDELAPFGGGAVFPLGRLREPLEGLARADAIVITRSEHSPGTYNIEPTLRRYNPNAPLFHARSVPDYWVEAATGRRIPALEPPFSRVGAFCGLGNPESFFRTLELLGIHLADCVIFGDHHSYRRRQMRGLVNQFLGSKAEAALTTEKDAINLCEGCVALMAPMPVYWLKIRVEIDREAELMQWIEDRLASEKDRRVSHA